MDQRRVNPKPTRQLADRLLAFQCFQRDLGLELWVMLLPFRHLCLLRVEDQQTTNCSLRQCPNFGGEVAQVCEGLRIK